MLRRALLRFTLSAVLVPTLAACDDDGGSSGGTPLGEGEGSTEGEGEGATEGEGEGSTEGEGEGSTEGEGEGPAEGEGEGPVEPCAPGILINEILYNPEGLEQEGHAFVELSGRAGRDLGEWELVRMRSNGLLDGAALGLEGTIGGSGYFLIGESATVQGGAAADLVRPEVDGVNTAYAFQLFCGGDLMDAVAYGAWEGDPGGEGLPAAGVPEGQSLSRCPDRADTGNNRADLRASPITPGAPNDLCPPPPEGCGGDAPDPQRGDLVVNEVAPEPVASGSVDAPEFIEVVNVSGHAVDLSFHRLAWNPTGEDDQGFAKELPLAADTCLPPDGTLLAWGREDRAPELDGVLTIARPPLLIRNDGSEVHVLNQAGESLASLCFGEGDGCGPVPTVGNGVGSITRDPDMAPLPGGELVPHDVAWFSGGDAASPGTCQDGTAFADGCPELPNEGRPCAAEVPSGVILNEIGFDPARDLNRDGVTNARDEFVEIFNRGQVDVGDLTGFTLSDEREVQATLGAISLPAGQALVLLATPNEDDACPDAGALGEGIQHVCVGALSMNDDGDTLTLANAGGEVLDQVTYGPSAPPCINGAVTGQSLTRFPDLGPRWVPHTRANRRATESPGRRVDGEAF